MKFKGDLAPSQWQSGASFLPTAINMYDFDAGTLRWHDLFIYRYIALSRVAGTLPTHSMQTQNRVTAKTPVGGSTALTFCKRCYAGDHRWTEISDMHMTVVLLKSVNGITKTHIGQTDVEILGLAHRVKVDLTYMDRCRVVFGGVNSAAVTFYCKILYSTNGVNRYDLTPEGASDGTADEQVVVGAWGNVPTGALSDVYIRAVGRAADDLSDPTYKAIELQVR